jgi:hypothetical protein
MPGDPHDSCHQRKAKGTFFIVQINRRDGNVITNPPAATIVDEGDGVVLIGRPNRAAILSCCSSRAGLPACAGEAASVSSQQG